MSGLSDPLKYKKFFGQYNGDFDNRREIETYDNMAAEYSGIKGIPIEYYPLCIDDYADGVDVVYGENDKPKWDRKYVLTGLLDDFTGELINFDGRGLTQVNEIAFFIHRSTFDKLVGIRSINAPTTNPERVGAYGPVAKDELRTPHNGLIYEVLTGGLHFLPGEAQHFGHKFWYKVSCKIRETSAAVLGDGEQYGAFPNAILPDIYTGNPQFEMPSPTLEEMAALEIAVVPQSGTDNQPPVEYITTGAPPGPSDGTVPADIFLDDGRVADKYKVEKTKIGSQNGQQLQIEATANEIIDPQTDQIDTPGTSGATKYGPFGIVIKNHRDIWGDW